MITVNFDKIAIKNGFKILDMGCGTGRHMGGAISLGRIFVIGADINADDIKKAKQRMLFLEKMGLASGKWAFTLTDIRYLPFDDNIFDIVICSEVLEHIKDDKKAVSEMLRVLKPAGDLVVSVPRHYPERICWMLSKSYGNSPGGHIRIYKKSALTNMIEKSGAIPDFSHFAHALHTPYWWLKCLLGIDRKDIPVINLYHDFLVWDMMKKPGVLRFFEKLFNPVLGKSIVLYFKKTVHKL